MLAAVLLAVLAVIAAMQLLMTGGDDLPPTGVGRVALAMPKLSVLPAPPASIILQRPLFGPGRGAAGGGGGASSLGGAVVAGSMARGRVRRLFLREADGTIVTLAPGGDYRGWRLVAITEEGARFARGTEQLKINYGSQTPETASGDDEDEPEEE